MSLNVPFLRRDLAPLVRETAEPSIPLPHVGTVQLVTGPGVLGFKLDGTLRWMVDEKWFGGTPVLTYGAHGTDYRIELNGALYAGTSLPANFVMVLQQRSVSGTPMDLSMTLGGFHSQAILELWLGGTQRLSSQVNLAATVCALGTAGHVTLNGPASAIFGTNWETAYSGSFIAAISGLGTPQESNSFALRVLVPGEPSFRTAPKRRRTLLTLQRGGHNWTLAPSPLALAIGTLTPHANLFDRIDIEAGENSAADVDHTLVAQSPSGEKLSFSPAGHFTDLDGQPFTVPLNAARFAVDFETSQTFLSARFPAAPTWFQLEGFVLEIADLANAPTFEVDATGGSVTSSTCAPALLRACAPLAGPLAAKPLTLSGSSPLHFVASPGSTPGWGVLAGTAAPGSPKLSLPEFAVGLLRRDDLLSLELLFTNLALEGDGQSPRLAKIDATKDALVTARFNAPQNLAEQAFEEQPPEPLVAPPVAVLAAGPSRLVFKLTESATSLAYTVDSLLDWKQFDLNVTRAAALPDPPPLPANPPSPAPPLATDTAIEAPWRLLLSPNTTAGFAHASSAVTRGMRTELWHTRLGIKKMIRGMPHVDEQDPSTRKVRAIWSPDYQAGSPPPPGGGPFRMSLDANDRDQIVVRSSDFSNPQLPPKAIDVDRLTLSALGAWMDVDGRWDAQGAFTIIEWRHRAAMARDSYVKVVKLGHLVPFGHRAVLIEITERKFLENPAGRTTAYLMKRQYIVVKEPEKDYGYLAATTTNQGRDFPYQRVRITTLVTPNLDTPDNQGQHFFPRVNGTSFLFHLVGTDRDGRSSDFTAPLVFADTANDLNGFNDYVGASLAIRRRDMGGQLIAFADSSASGNPPPSSTGKTSFNAATMTFSAGFFSPFIPAPRGQPQFYPLLDPATAAEVTIPALQQITGSSSAVPIVFYPDYLTSNFKKGGVFLQLVNPLGVQFSGDQTGGLAKPNLNVGGLSRDFGTVSGAGAALSTFSDGRFDPKQYFGAITGAKLLGFIPLTDIIALIADVTGAPEKVPKLLTNRLPDRIVTSLAWKPDVTNWSIGFASVRFPGVPSQHLELDVTISTPIGGGTPHATIQGHLRNFDVELLKVIALHFNSVDFLAAPGRKLDLTADVGKVQFEGDLEFLNSLQQLIPAKGFSDPPSIDVTSQGVTVGYSLAIPSVGVGVFSLENIRLGAALELSFVDEPIRFRFNFSERQHPFLVTVSLLGGGGFFGLQLGPDGIEMLEASIEFGANVSLDLVVASANVHIMAGVYLKLDFATKASQLTGYLRAGGSANVLGLVTVSVEFYLGFTYYAAHVGTPCKIAGEALVTVEVDVLMFSESVSLSLRREFSDPRITFAELIKPHDWIEYCDAFAA